MSPSQTFMYCTTWLILLPTLVLVNSKPYLRNTIKDTQTDPKTSAYRVGTNSHFTFSVHSIRCASVYKLECQISYTLWHFRAVLSLSWLCVWSQLCNDDTHEALPVSGGWSCREGWPALELFLAIHYGIFAAWYWYMKYLQVTQFDLHDLWRLT